MVGAFLFDSEKSAFHDKLGAKMMKQISLAVLAGFYVLAGLNHFLNQEFYLPLIPDYLPYPEWINLASGLLEVFFGIALVPIFSRKWAVYAIIIMLLAFIPSHVYFIEIGGCVEDGLCAPLWVAWVRLVVVHPLLIAWAWYHRK